MQKNLAHKLSLPQVSHIILFKFKYIFDTTTKYIDTWLSFQFIIGFKSFVQIIIKFRIENNFVWICPYSIVFANNYTLIYGASQKIILPARDCKFFGNIHADFFICKTIQFARELFTIQVIWNKISFCYFLMDVLHFESYNRLLSHDNFTRNITSWNFWLEGRFSWYFMRDSLYLLENSISEIPNF